MSDESLKEIDFMDYSERGYIIFRDMLTPSEIEYLRSVLGDLYKKSKKVYSDIKVRCYDDLPYVICGGVNVTTIEDFASRLPLGVSNILFKKKLVEYAEKLIQKKPLSLELFRIHVTGKFSYEGPWHRDQELSENDSYVLCNLYIYDETGMRFFDKKADIHRDSSVHFGQEIENNDYQILTARAGDVVFLDPKLIHKPFCIKKRLHIHLRFSSSFKKTQDFLSYKDSRMYYQRALGPISGVKRLLKGFIYGISKKNY